MGVGEKKKGLTLRVVASYYETGVKRQLSEPRVVCPRLYVRSEFLHRTRTFIVKVAPVSCRF